MPLLDSLTRWSVRRSFQAKPTRHPAWKVGGAFAAALVVTLMTVIAFVLLFPEEYGPHTHRPAPIKVPDSHVQPGSFDRVWQGFGPWHTIANGTVPRDRKLVVMLMDNGTKVVGSKQVNPDSNWRPTLVVNITAAERHGQDILIRTDNGTTYVLAIGQPFLLQAHPETVYAYDPAVKLVAAPAATFLS